MDRVSRMEDIAPKRIPTPLPWGNRLFIKCNLHHVAA